MTENKEIKLLNKNNLQENVQKLDKNDYKGIVVNGYDNLTALSNRRLNYQTLPFPFKLDWSIDRITVVGYLKEFDYSYSYINDDGEIIYERGEKFTLDNAMSILAREGAAERIGNGWQLIDKYGENIAYIEVLPFKDRDSLREKARIDFNPNKLEQFTKISLKELILLAFDKPHFSRADIACDIFNIPNEYISQYRLVDAVSFRPYYGKNGALETAYWGARSSERQVRMYNKYLEQQKKKQFIPEERETWWRLELQLRRNRTDEWVEVVNDTLSSFYSPFYLPLDLKATDKVMISGLHSNHELWHELSDKTKRKYRKILKEISKEDELTQHLKASFSDSLEKLKRELEAWLVGIDVTE